MTASQRILTMRQQDTNGTAAGSSAGSGTGRTASQRILEQGIRSGQAQRQDRDYNTWLSDVEDFSRRVSGDYDARRDTWQEPEAFQTYREQTGAELDDLLARARAAGSYYTQYGRLYDETRGAGSSGRLLYGIAQNMDWLEGVRRSLEQEGQWRGQFADRAAFDTYQRHKGYAQLPQAEDFGEKSAYVSTYRPGTEKFNAWTGRYVSTGFGDIDYDYINRDETARKRQLLTNIQNNAALLGLDNSERGEMTDEEIAVFNYLYALDTEKGDTEHTAAWQYIQDLTEELNFRQRESAEAQWGQYADAHPVRASAFSILMSPVKGLSYVGQAADYFGDGSIDQNAGYNKLSYIPAAIRGRVSQGIRDAGGAGWGDAGSFLYGTGMSMGDFLLNAAVTGGLAGGGAASRAASLGMMGLGAAADRTVELKDAGMSDTRSFILGGVAGAAEILTEKFSLDALLDGKLERSAFQYIVKNAFTEGTEEVGSDLLNWLADDLYDKIAGEENSEWKRMIRAYEEQGLTPEEAVKRALQDRAEEAAADFLGGALSGGVMAGGSVALNAAAEQVKGHQNAALEGETPRQDGRSPAPSGDTPFQKGAEGADVQRQGGTGNGPHGGGRANGDGAHFGAGPMGTSAPTQQESQYRGPLAQTARDARMQAARNITAVDRAAEVFGEQGRYAARTLYDGGDPAGYYGAFAAYYQAGATGRDMAGVRGEWAAQLSEAQRQAAWEAGRNDAAAGLAREKTAAGYAPVAGTESGLVYDGFVRRAVESGRTAEDVNGETRVYLSAEAAEKINRVARELGLRVRFADSVDGGTANARIRGSEVLIEKDNPNPVMFLMGHELTHRVQQLAPEQYRAFRAAAMEADGDLVRRKIDAYAAQGVKLSYEQAMDEVAADYAGRLIDDGKVLDEFIRRHRDDRTLLQKLRDAIRALVRKLTGAEKQQARAAEQTLTAALNAAAEQAKSLEAKDGRSPAASGGTQYRGPSGTALRAGGTRSAPTEATAENGPHGGGRANGGGAHFEAGPMGTPAPTQQESQYRGPSGTPAPTQTDGGAVRYSLNGKEFTQDKYFARQMDRWETLADNSRVKVGEVRAGSALARVGLPAAGMYFDVGKIKKAMAAHGDHLTAEVMKGIPDLLNDPIVITEYGGPTGTVKNTVNVYGNLFVGNTPVVVGVVMHLDRSGQNVINNIRTVHARSDFARQITDDSVLYLNEDKKKTRSWFQVCGNLNVPLEGAKYGLIRSIAFDGGDVNPRYSLKEYSQSQRDDWANSKSIVIYESQAQLRQFIQDAIDGKNLGKKLYFGAIPADLAARIEADTGLNVEGYNCTLRATEVRKITNGHGTERSETSRGQRAITAEDFLAIPEVIQSPDSISLSGKLFEGKPVILFTKELNGRTTVVSYVSGKHMDLTVQTMYAGVKKESLATTPSREKGSPASHTSETLSGTAHSDSIPQDGGEVKGEYSLKAGTVSKSAAALETENRRLRERLDWWRGQVKRTKAPTIDSKSVRAAARRLVKDYGAGVDAGELAGQLQSLYNDMAQGKADTDAALERAEGIARQLAESALETDDGPYREYADLRRYLRTTEITFGTDYHGDIGGREEMADFRKSLFGKVDLKTAGTGTNVDAVYQELCVMFPSLFHEGQYTHPADQMRHIARVAQELYRRTQFNPYSHDMETAVRGIAHDITDTFLTLPETRATFADRQAAKLEQAVAEGRARTKKAIERERAARAREVRELRQAQQERDAAGREQRSARELRGKIVRHVRSLSEKLLRPTDRAHIPEELRGAVAATLEAINRESNFEYSYGKDGVSHRVEPGTEPDGTPTKRTEAFRALREQYEAISRGQTDFTGVVDPDLLPGLTEVIAMRDTRLADMSSAQLTTVWQVVRAVEHSVTTANRLLGQSRAESVRELAESIRDGTGSRRAKGNWRGPVGWADRLLNLDMMDPVTFFHQLGEGGDALYHELQAARDRKTRILARAIELANEAAGKTDVKKLEQQTHTFQVEGGELTLTTAQIMSLYELSKREQAQEHIYKGGLRAAPINGGVGRGRSAAENVAAALGRTDAPSAGVRVTRENVADILAALTDGQKELADALQGIMQGYLAQEGNRESMRVYGYRKFTEEHYFPISSDPHQVQEKIGDVLEGGQKRPRSIAEWGSAKATVQKASNGLLLGDIFDVFAQHTVDMATYASHLGAMEDLQRVRNFTFRDSRGQRTGTMADILQRVTGQGGGAYLNKLLQDVSAGTARDSVTGLGRLTANYKAASVGANLRVALQQPTAYLRAAAVIDMKYLADPRVLKKGGWARALKYAPIAVWKDWGNFEINQGRQLQNIMFDTDSRLERVRNAAMWLAGQMDSVTWGRLWNACELETADTRPELARGSEAFYEAAAQRFTDLVDQTQVVDNVLGRSQLMRSGDALAKMATSYMGEPTKSYNLVYRAARDLAQEQDGARRTAARKTLGRAVTALAASQFLNAVAQALWDAVRDDDRDRKYWERVLGHIGGNFLDNINPAGMVPYVKDVFSSIQGYDVKRMDMEAITGFISACRNVDKAVKGEGRYTLAGAAANLLAETARIFGLPAATVKRDLVALARSVGIETGDWYFQYRLETALNSVGYSGNRGELYDIAWGALKDGETEVYQTIMEDLMSRGVKAASIESAMRDRLEKALKDDPDFALGEQARDLIGVRETHGEAQESERFTAADLDPAQYRVFSSRQAAGYRAVADELEGFSTFAGLDGAVRDKALAAADTLAAKLALESASDGAYTADTGWMLWATGGGDAGVSEAEAILFKVAYDMIAGDVDPDTGRTVAGSKKENVLEAAEDWMPWLTDGELEYLMKNYWKE